MGVGDENRYSTNGVEKTASQLTIDDVYQHQYLSNVWLLLGAVVMAAYTVSLAVSLHKNKGV